MQPLRAANEQLLLNQIWDADLDEEGRRFTLTQLSQIGGSNSLLTIQSLCQDDEITPALRIAAQKALDTIKARLDHEAFAEPASTPLNKEVQFRQLAGEIERMSSRIERIFAGPEMTNFSGVVCVDVYARGENKPLRSDGKGRACAPAGMDCELVCWLEPQRIDEARHTAPGMAAGVIQIENGVDKPSADFKVTLDCDTLRFTPPSRSLTATIGIASPMLRFPFTAPQTSGENRIWVQVSQQNRLLEAVSLRVIVTAGSDEGTAPSLKAMPD